jgi:hypothetical protein
MSFGRSGGSIGETVRPDHLARCGFTERLIQPFIVFSRLLFVNANALMFALWGGSEMLA